MKTLWKKLRTRARRMKLWLKRKWIRSSEIAAQRVMIFNRGVARFDRWYAKMHSQILVFFATFFLTCAVCLLMFPPWLTVAIMGVILVHEMGHWYMAHELGVDVRLPIFIPLLFGVAASTEVPGLEADLDPRIIMAIAIAGPTLGGLAATFVIIVGAILGLPAVMWTGGTLLAFQVFSITLGSDGRAYRRASKELPDNARRGHLTLVSNRSPVPA